MSHNRLTSTNKPLLRFNWQKHEIRELFEKPFNDLLFQAQQIHRNNFNPNQVQVSTLLSIKTGKCPEDCSYCPQSVRYDTELEDQSLLSLEEVLQAAKQAKNNGASRFCMGAAWRSPKDRDIQALVQMIQGVRELGLETCLTAGMLSQQQAQTLKQSGLDYYNHNLDTSPEFYGEVISTRSYDDRLATLDHVRDVDLKVCCGGILGMGESRDDRIGLLQQLANMESHPQSVPINMLVRVAGTPLAQQQALDPLEFVRTIASARILMPESYVRLSAGRETMSDEMQALCYLSGANSIFYGEKLLTTPNPEMNTDKQLFDRLGIESI